MLCNLGGLAILIAGMLVLSEQRTAFIDARKASLETQAQMIANLMANLAVAEGASTLDHGEARRIFDRLGFGVDVAGEESDQLRVRLFGKDGDDVADSLRSTGGVLGRELPAPETRAQGAWRLTGWRETQRLEAERDRALRGESNTSQRLNDAGARIVSASVPITAVETVVGVVTVEATGVDNAINEERRRMLPYALGALLVSMASSLGLAIIIAQPLRRLANAADALRRSGGTRLQVPEASKRADEIGDLARAMERMTSALAERIDANERFAADVAHEIKNPLTSIRSAVETTRALRDPDSRERLLAIIASDVGRLDRLITDIAQASRLEAETARGVSQRVDLGRLMSELTETYAATRREGEAAVMFRGPSPPDALTFGQEGPIGQVFRNLIDNAKSFSPADGVVTVLVETIGRRERKWVRVSVSDQGPGIPDENLEAIFDRFYTDRPKGSAFGGNSGLGLSIARQIVEAHKGRIWAENIPGVTEGQRLGARFIAEFPAAPTAPDVNR